MATTVAPKIAEQDGLGNILALFQAIAPQLGSGKSTNTQSGTSIATSGGTSTSVQTGTVDPGVKAQSDALIQSLMQLGDSDAVDAQVAAILQKAKESFAPNIGNSLAGGNRAYSDTTLQRLAADATGRATAEAASAKLSFQKDIQSQIATLVNTQLNATKGQTTTASENKTINETKSGTGVQQTGMTPAGKGVSALGLGLTGLSTVNKLLKARNSKVKPEDFGKQTGGAIDAATGLSPTELSNIFSGGAPITDVMSSLAFPAAANPNAVNLMSAPISDGTFGSSFQDNIWSIANDNMASLAAPALEEAPMIFADLSSNITGTTLDAPAVSSVEPVIGQTDFASSFQTVADPFAAPVGDPTQALTIQPVSNEYMYQITDETGTFTVPGQSLIDSGYQGLTNSGQYVSSLDASQVGQYYFDASAGLAEAGAAGFSEAGAALGGAASFIGPAISLAQGNVGSAVGSTIGAGVGAIFGPVGSAVGSAIGGMLLGGDSVICTELYRQGIMSDELYRQDIEFARSYLSKTTLRGYRVWAIPWVRAMRTSKWLSKISAFFAINRAKSLSERNWIGSCFRRVFEPICFCIGLFVRKEPDYSILYKTEGMIHG